MKPVVSSLVALALAIAPLSAMAKPSAHHPHKTAAHVTGAAKTDAAGKDKTAKIETSEKSDKSEKAAPMLRVKAGRKDGAATKPALHHAHNVDLGGGGHREPKVDHGGAIVQASMKTKETHHKPLVAKPAAASELPKLPNANAGKPSKGGAEKGARKPAAQKSEAGSDNDGQSERDEDLAELVALIRGQRSSPSGEESPAPGDTKGAKSGALQTTSSKTPCTKEPVEVIRGPEVERFELTRCDGSIAPLAVEHLSILVRPGGAARPTAPLAELAKKPGPELGHGVRRVDSRLVERIQSVVEHFGKSGSPAKLFVISGYRPASIGSMHSTGRAIDFRVEGVKNEDVVAFCKTLGDTGCGFYPNSSFVHIDVRDPGAGHVTWIDASGPGETPRYVSAWPPKSAHPPSAVERASATEEITDESDLRARRPLDRESVPEPVDDHPAEVETP